MQLISKKTLSFFEKYSHLKVDELSQNETFKLDLNTIILIIKRRIEDLSKEEENINQLIIELQEKTFKEKKAFTPDYYKQMYYYENRLGEIRQLNERLRAKRIRILSLADEIRRLNEESKDAKQIKPL